MGKTYDEITDSLREFIERQHMFFVATAPLGSDGLINLSPKGYDTFRILDRRTVAYLDLTGSGIETVAHLKENGRLTIMFCAFDGRPNIVRLYGHGTVLEPGDAEFETLLTEFPQRPGTRSIIKLEAHRISDSCGWAVPLMEFQEDRDQLDRYASQLPPEVLLEKQMKGNTQSLDGLPGLRHRTSP